MNTVEQTSLFDETEDAIEIAREIRKSIEQRTQAVPVTHLRVRKVGASWVCHGFCLDTDLPLMNQTPSDQTGEWFHLVKGGLVGMTAPLFPSAARFTIIRHSVEV
jgi:hypothetical protein